MLEIHYFSCGLLSVSTVIKFIQLLNQTDVAYIVSKGHQIWILQELDKRKLLCQNRKPYIGFTALYATMKG